MEITATNTKINHSLLKTKKISFNDKNHSIPIFHYTSVSGLQGILGNKKLFFTDIRFLNDTKEILTGLESFITSFNISTQKDRFYKLINDMNESYFVCCFSLDGDSLPMWNYYTKEPNNQGYNIEFDDKMLIENILRHNPCLDGCDLAFGIVDYCEDNLSRYSKILKNDFQITADNFCKKIGLFLSERCFSDISSKIHRDTIEEIKKEIADNEKKKQVKCIPIYLYNGKDCCFEKEIIYHHIYFIKQNCFSQEKEFRFLISVPKENLEGMKKQGIYKFRVSNGILVPYLELSFPSEVVKSVMISPTVKSDLVELSMQEFLQYSGYEIPDFAHFIKHSKVPIRF